MSERQGRSDCGSSYTTFSLHLAVPDISLRGISLLILVLFIYVILFY
jgi:hypothetical protein